MLKRQFLDFLQNHKYKHKKIFNFKHPKKGYVEFFSPLQLLKEIEQETEIGKEILQNLKYQEQVLLNLSMNSNSKQIEDFIQELTKNGDSLQENKGN